MLSEKEYVKAGGSKCPKCKSKDIEYTGKDHFCGQECSHLVFCNNCEFTYWDQYQLAGFEPAQAQYSSAEDN